MGSNVLPAIFRIMNQSPSLTMKINSQFQPRQCYERNYVALIPVQISFLTSHTIAVGTLLLTLTSAFCAADATSNSWQIGTPIVTYWAGPPMDDAAAEQMAQGGFNLVWCTADELDVVKRHELRGQLHDPLLVPASLESPDARQKLDALIDRVRHHPALYSYFITDEPNATNFPSLGKLVHYLRERDPARLAYINLFPTYATNEQLGNRGDIETAYRSHLREFVDRVQPALLSYDHYQFTTKGDSEQYFLNLALIRQAAQDAGVPFLNIVQAATWTPSMRIPKPDEMRYLVYTTLAYGAQGISYYVYSCPGHTGGIANADRTPTPLYHALKSLNREFVAVAAQLQPLRSFGVYHTGMLPPGAVALPKDAPITLEQPEQPIQYKPPERVKGILLGYFGSATRNRSLPTHVLVVNLDYGAEVVVGLHGVGKLQLFDPNTGNWESTKSRHRALRLPPGGGTLARLGS
jgi:hypothetical protein